MLYEIQFLLYYVLHEIQYLLYYILHSGTHYAHTYHTLQQFLISHTHPGPRQTSDIMFIAHPIICNALRASASKSTELPSTVFSISNPRQALLGRLRPLSIHERPTHELHSPCNHILRYMTDLIVLCFLHLHEFGLFVACIHTQLHTHTCTQSNTQRHTTDTNTPEGKKRTAHNNNNTAKPIGFWRHNNHTHDLPPPPTHTHKRTHGVKSGPATPRPSKQKKKRTLPKYSTHGHTHKRTQKYCKASENPSCGHTHTHTHTHTQHKNTQEDNSASGAAAEQQMYLPSYLPSYKAGREAENRSRLRNSLPPRP